MQTISCTIAGNFVNHFADPSEEVARELRGRCVDGLRELTAVTQRAPFVSEHDVVRRYDFECAVTTVGVKVGSDSLELLAYGASAAILDYKGMVARLLTPDAQALETELGRSTLRLWRRNEELEKVMARFLSSEVNVDIDNESYVRQGIIDAAYAARTKTSTRRALVHVFARYCGLALATTTLVPSATFLIVAARPGVDALNGWTVPILAGAALLPLAVCEHIARSRVKARFDELSTTAMAGLGEKFDALLVRYGTIWLSRGASLGASAALFGAVAAIRQYLIVH